MHRSARQNYVQYHDAPRSPAMSPAVGKAQEAVTAAESAAASVGVSFSALAHRQTHPCPTAQPRQTVPPSHQPVSPPAAQQVSAQQASDASVAHDDSETSLDAASNGDVAGGDVIQGNCGTEGNQPVDLDQVSTLPQSPCRSFPVCSEYFWTCCILLPSTGCPNVPPRMAHASVLGACVWLCSMY